MELKRLILQACSETTVDICRRLIMPVRVAEGVEAWPDSTRLVQKIAGSNPASGMDVCVRLCVCNLKTISKNGKTF